MERVKRIARNLLGPGGLILAGIGALSIYAAAWAGDSVQGGIVLAVAGLTIMMFGLER